MLSVRVIPCLDLHNGRVVKGVNFVNLKDAGDPVEVARRYNAEGADEIVFLDITATHEGRNTMLDVISRAAEQVFIPLTVGGGIKSTDDFKTILRCGADKISINSSAVRNPSLITDAAMKFGRQCVVVAIDTRTHADGKTTVYLNGGRIDTGIDALEWACAAEKAGAGELLITSMNCDGTQDGYDNAFLSLVNAHVGIPVVASGGAGTLQHFADAVKVGGANAVLAASLFHYGKLSITEVKRYMASQGIAVRL